MNWFLLVISYIYSLFFCLRYLPLSQAKKIPILIHPKTKISKLHKGDIRIEGRIWKAMIVIGFQGSRGRCNKRTIIHINKGAQLVFKGYARLAKGCAILVEKGEMVFGHNMRFNGDCCLACNCSIIFDEDVVCGWNVQFLTNNGHAVIIDGVVKEQIKPIKVGKHVWIGSDSVIGKGVEIPDGCVLAHHSIVVKSLPLQNSLYGGYPAKMIKSNVTWKY